MFSEMTFLLAESLELVVSLGTGFVEVAKVKAHAFSAVRPEGEARLFSFR